MTIKNHRQQESYIIFEDLAQKRLISKYRNSLINKNFLKHDSIIVDPNWPQGSEQHQREGYVPFF